MGAGQTHHFALAVPDEETQLAWRERLVRAGLARLAGHGSRLLQEHLHQRPRRAHRGTGDGRAGLRGRRAARPTWGRACSCRPGWSASREAITRRLRPLTVPDWTGGGGCGMTSDRQPPPPHGGGPVCPRRRAAERRRRRRVILIHGRGASAEDILDAGRRGGPRPVAYLAPQARGNTWYPEQLPGAHHRATSRASPRGWRCSARCSRTVAAAGHPAGARGAARLLAGRLPDAGVRGAPRPPLRRGGRPERRPDRPRRHAARLPGALGGTPVFLGCSDVDFHIPKERVAETAAILRRLGGDVTMRLYPNMGHTVNADEIARTRALLLGLVS